MPDDGDYSKDQKKVNQAAGDVESCEPEKPKYEQNYTDEQKHGIPPKAFRYVLLSRILVNLGLLHLEEILKKIAEGNLHSLVLCGSSCCQL